MNTWRNLAIAFLQKQGQTLISIVSMLVLARLVAPEETGIFSVGVAITAVTHAIRDFGVGNFLIKEPRISPASVRTAFTVSMAIATALALALFAAAGPAARFYEQAEVATVIQITSVGLLLSPFSTVNLAILLREQRFFDMFKVSISGALPGALVSVVAAWYGLGATALALGSLANSVALAVAANIVLPRFADYLPSLASWRPILHFGLHSAAQGMVEQVGGRASDLLLGKVLGFGPVGLLNRAGSLITLFQDAVLAAIAPVVLASMARDARRGDPVVTQVLVAIEHATVMAWPFFAVLAMFARDAVLLLFGPQWEASAPYTGMLCFAAALTVPPGFVCIAATARGRVDLLSRFTVAHQIIRVALIALGTLGGLDGVAQMLMLAAAIQCGLAFTMLRRAVAVPGAALLRRVWRSLAVAAWVAVTLVPIQQGLHAAPGVRIAAVAIVATLAWLAGLFVARHPAAAFIAGLAAQAWRRLGRN